MEFTSGKFNRNERILLEDKEWLKRQVRDQSPECDFTVVQGCWSMRFHSRVLAFYPFFNCMLQHNFREREARRVDMHIGTPSTLKSAIMLLYGVSPSIKMSNVEHFLDIAEFLHIPQLKSRCVKYINEHGIIKKTCVRMLNLCLIYGLPKSYCMQYIRENLDDILSKSEAVEFTSDILQELFSDKSLSYVSMEIKFKFLVRWAKENIESRIKAFKELLSLIKLEYISLELLGMSQDNADIANVFMHSQEKSMTKIKKRIKVLATGNHFGDGFFLYDLEGKSWYRHDIDRRLFSPCLHSDKFLGATSDNKSLLVYGPNADNTQSGLIRSSSLYRSQYKKQCIYAYDIETDRVMRISLLPHDTKSGKRGIVSRGYYHEIHTQKVFSRHLVRLNRSRPEQHQIRMTSKAEIPVTTLSIAGINFEDGYAFLEPILSVPGEVDEMCVNNAGVVAMVQCEANRVLLYTRQSTSVDMLPISIKDKCYRINKTEHGFVIIRPEHIVYIGKPSYEASGQKYVTSKEIPLEPNLTRCTGLYRYIPVDDRIIRYNDSRENGRFYVLEKGDVITYECATHEQLYASKSSADVHWTSMETPPYCFFPDVRMELITVPETLLRCHGECPHCEKMKTRPSETSINFAGWRRKRNILI